MSSSAGLRRRWVPNLVRRVWLSFAEFLALPAAIILAFLVLSLGAHLLDLANLACLVSLRDLLQEHIFANPGTTSNLLSTVAESLITLTSLTVPLLLLALQQSAANMSAQIVDQFLRRRINQVYFGFFVGAALYSLVILATVNKPFNPIYGGALALLFTAIALCMLIVALYTTIDQMRPVQIMEAIHDHVLAARRRELILIGMTRRAPSEAAWAVVAGSIPIKTDEDGFVTRINVDAIGKVLQRLPDEVEIVLQVELGTYVAFQDTIATVKIQAPLDVAALTKIILAAVILERRQDITADATYGVKQLAMIGWTAISSAQSSLRPGLLAILTLRDLLARWSAEDNPVESKAGGEPKLWPIVYRDNGFEHLLDAFESLAVISSESMQYQAFAEVLRALAIMYPRIPAEHQSRVENLLQRILAVLGDHALTRELDSALCATVQMLKANDCAETASLVENAQSELQQSVGKLNSRATRVPHGS